MIEYIGEDSKEIGQALATLVRKCAEGKSNQMEVTITVNDTLALDCYFAFREHDEGQEQMKGETDA